MDALTGTLLATQAGLAAKSLFSKPSGPSYGNLDALYTRRRQEIGDFANQLSQARTRYLSSLQNMYTDAFNRFGMNAEAQFAGRGLSVLGGAYQSALARESASLQGQLNVKAFEAEREDLYNIDKAYADAASMNAGGRAEQDLYRWKAGREDSAALGNFIGNLTSYRLSRYGNPEDNMTPRTGAVRKGRRIWDDEGDLGPSWNG